MRRPTTVEAMLLATIALWSLNLTVTRYILTHGFEPLAYSVVRYGGAVVAFLAIVWVAERSFRVARRDLRLVVLTATILFLNQICFVYALKLASAATIALILGATPMVAALLGAVLRTEELTPRFWLGAVVSFAGVGLVAAGSGGDLSGDTGGVLFGLGMAATWAAYSVGIAPLMARYSPSRISALVLGASWLPMLLVGLPQLGEQRWGLPWEVWPLLVFATLGPLVLTNVFWFRSLHRIGPSRATLAANLQPFAAAVVALILLGEPIAAVQVVGGVLVAGGILLARGRRSSPLDPSA